MKNNPKVSVLMSVYNAEKYLEEAIQSILNQTYKNFEFIIINDGSIDKSLDIIKKYAQKDKRIVLISRENKGLVESLNEGISVAKGKYIARMDADDISMPNRLEEQVKYMEQNKLCLCGSWVQPFSKKRFNIWKYPIKQQDIIFRLFFTSSFAHPSVMINKKVFKKLLYKKVIAEDYQLWCDIIHNGFKVGNIPKVLLKYRLHSEQITQTKILELTNSVNHIKLTFVKNMNPEFYKTVEKSIFLQSYPEVKQFQKVIYEVENFSKLYNIDRNNSKFVLNYIYNSSKSKNLRIYVNYIKFMYKHKYKLSKKDIFLFFIKSFIKENSVLYKSLIFMRNKFFYKN